jgi:lipopolysaccharide transport system permease protein
MSESYTSSRTLSPSVTVRQNNPDSWTRVIRPRRGVGIDVGELWRFRELLVFLVWRNILIRYKQTVIGVAWALVQPILTVFVFTVVFGTLANLPSDGAPYPVLTLAAVLPWQFFANGLTAGSNSIVNAANMIRKIYFPRMFIPLSECLSGSLDFVVSLVLLLGLMLWCNVAFTRTLLLLPVFAVMALLAALGPSLWLSALNARYRDVKYIVPFLVQAGLYVSPVGFSSAVVPERWRFWYHLNPLVGVIDGFRWAILGPNFAPEWRALALSILIVAALLLSGLFYFRTTERTFADVI